MTAQNTPQPLPPSYGLIYPMTPQTQRAKKNERIKRIVIEVRLSGSGGCHFPKCQYPVRARKRQSFE
jgi:hypothetical protein